MGLLVFGMAPIYCPWQGGGLGQHLAEMAESVHEKSHDYDQVKGWQHSGQCMTCKAIWR